MELSPLLVEDHLWFNLELVCVSPDSAVTADALLTVRSGVLKFSGGCTRRCSDIELLYSCVRGGLLGGSMAGRGESVRGAHVGVDRAVVVVVGSGVRSGLLPDCADTAAISDARVDLLIILGDSY